MQGKGTEITGQVMQLIAELKGLEGPLLPILHAVQRQFGHVPNESLPIIAEALNLSRAEVHGVVSFYHDFRDAPAGRHVLKICRSEACQSMGAEALVDKIRQHLKIDWHQTTPDGAVTLEPVYCLGLCACSPAAMLDDELVGRADAAQLLDMLAENGR